MDILVLLVIFYYIFKMIKKANQAAQKAPNMYKKLPNPKTNDKGGFWSELQKEIANAENSKGEFWEKLNKELGIDEPKVEKPKKPKKRKKKAVQNIQKDQTPEVRQGYRPLESRLTHRMYDINETRYEPSGSIEGVSSEGMGSSEGEGSDVCVFDNMHSPIAEPARTAAGMFASITSSDILNGVIMSEVLNRKF